MSNYTIQDFLTRHPEFNSLAPNLVVAVIDEAVMDTPESVWGIRHSRAIGLLTAHILTCRWEQLARLSGLATAATAGTISSLTPIENELATTTYGAQLKRLRDEYVVTMGFAG